MGSSYQADELWTQSSTKLCSKFLQSTSPPRTSSQPAWFCGCVYHIVPSLWGRVTAGSFFFTPVQSWSTVLWVELSSAFAPKPGPALAVCFGHGMLSTKAGPVSAAPLSSAWSLGQRVGSLLRSQDVVAGKTHPHWFQHAQTPDLCLIAAASVADRCYGHLCFEEGHQWSDLRYKTCLVICFLHRDFCTNVRWWKGQDTYCYHHPLPLPKDSNSHSSSTY